MAARAKLVIMKLANIVISCPDRPGIVKAVTTFLFDNGANISFMEQHIEDGFFFMRIEWQALSTQLRNAEEFNLAFKKISDEFEMSVHVDFNENLKKVAIFCSKELHCLVDILGRCEINELEIEIPYILSNFKDAENIAEKLAIPFYYIPSSEDGYEEKILQIVMQNQTDLIGLARYMKVLSADFVEKAQQKIINVHHSFLPSFVGAKPYDEAYERGVKLIGATSHYVTAELDQGPIIEQDVKRIKHSYEIANLKLMGRELEKKVFAFAIRKHVENKLIIYKNRTIVFE